MGFYGFEIVCASVFTVLCIVSARVYSLLNLAYSYWDKKKVNGPIPNYFFGTWKGFAQKFLGSEDVANSAKYGKIFGMFDGLTPNLMVTDPKVIKEVLDSSAESFQDVRVATENSVILKDSLLTLCGGDKKEVQILTNSLLNSYKLEKLIPKLESSVENLINSITKERTEDGRLNITSSVTEFINDAVALTIFGIELNADIQLKEEFVENTQQCLRVKAPESIKSLLPFLYANYFKDPWICPEKSLQYFVNLVMSGISQSSTEDALTEGKASNLIELMVQASDEEKKLVKKEKEDETGDIVLKDNVIISKCIASMLTLLNATRTVVVLGLYALAKNEDVQEKLFKEVEQNKSMKPSYENIQNLNYLDKVVKEVLRQYPFEFRLERVSNEKVKIGEVEIEKNIRVSIPLYSLHWSEDLYPEPEKFDPERFSLGASEKRSPFTYLPFGQAGVNGSDLSLQLGVLASKITLFRLVENFKFSEANKSDLNSLFKKGFTRVPQPERIEVTVEPRK